MDVKKQRWINKFTKYDFSLKYQKRKNNTMADALSGISEEHLSHVEPERVLEGDPVIPGSIQFLKSLKKRRKIGDQKRPLLTLYLPRP